MRWLLGSLVVAGLIAAPRCGLAQAAQGLASQDLPVQINAMVAEPAVARAHWGVMVTAMDGTPIYGLNEGQLFQPASNAKLFTTAAAMALLGPEKTFETRVVAKGKIEKDVLRGDLELIGGGDANLSGREFPYLSPDMRPKPQRGAPLPPQPDPLRYLEEMADRVAATGLKSVDGDVVGDDTYFAWEPYGADWAIDDMLWGYGAPVSALSVNDNQIKVTISAGMKREDPATIAMEPDVNYYTIENRVLSSNDFKNPVGIDRAPGSKVLTMYGGVALGSAPVVEEVAILDPAEYAAMALKRMLEERGITVKGTARADHWKTEDLGSFLTESKRTISDGTFQLLQQHGRVSCSDAGRPELSSEETVLASHLSVSLGEDVVWTNKASQNLHAEIMLRNIGKANTCIGRLSQGASVVRQFLINAGIDPEDFVFYDGSGLSGHDLVTPRATVKLLQYASTQPWFAGWKASLPVGGVDASLEHRFTKEPLKGHVFAKTGTLGEARALSGYVECASGRTVIFSIMVGNHDPGTSADREVMDRMVAAIAAAN